jgi:integrating conjugative element protein (TIGR03759 family)
MERSELAPSDRTKAQAWGLSATEWRRYRGLMEGIRGSVSPAIISPIEVLGIHARDDAERRDYAERWAVLMREDVDRILAFQRAYDEAGRFLFPGERLIDLTRLTNGSDDDTDLQVGDRVLFFTRPDCTACEALLERILGRLDRIAGIDVYLTGIAAGDERAVRDWATRRAIEPEWVRTRKVTLNFEAGALAQLVPAQGDLPYLMRRRGESVTVLPRAAW